MRNMTGIMIASTAWLVSTLHAWYDNRICNINSITDNYTPQTELQTSTLNQQLDRYLHNNSSMTLLSTILSTHSREHCKGIDPSMCIHYLNTIVVMFTATTALETSAQHPFHHINSTTGVITTLTAWKATKNSNSMMGVYTESTAWKISS